MSTDSLAAALRRVATDWSEKRRDAALEAAAPPPATGPVASAARERSAPSADTAVPYRRYGPRTEAPTGLAAASTPSPAPTAPGQDRRPSKPKKSCRRYEPQIFGRVAYGLRMRSPSPTPPWSPPSPPSPPIEEPEHESHGDVGDGNAAAEELLPPLPARPRTVSASISGSSSMLDLLTPAMPGDVQSEAELNRQLRASNPAQQGVGVRSERAKTDQVLMPPPSLAALAKANDGKAKESTATEGKAKEGKPKDAKEAKSKEAKAAKEGKVKEGKPKDGKAKESKANDSKASGSGRVSALRSRT